MTRGIHCAVGPHDRSVGADEVGDSARVTCIGFVAGTIGQADGSALVAKQLVGKVELFRKERIVFLVVKGNTENHGVAIVEILDSVPEPFAFKRSARCVCFWVKPQQNIFTRVIGTIHLFATVSESGEGGCACASFQHCHAAILGGLATLFKATPLPLFGFFFVFAGLR